MIAEDTVDLLRRFVEHAPLAASIPPAADDLLGWRVPPGLYVCATCAGRIMARGCSLPDGSAPHWRDSGGAAGACCCCE